MWLARSLCIEALNLLCIFTVTVCRENTINLVHR